MEIRRTLQIVAFAAILLAEVRAIIIDATPEELALIDHMKANGALVSLIAHIDANLPNNLVKFPSNLTIDFYNSFSSAVAIHNWTSVSHLYTRSYIYAQYPSEWAHFSAACETRRPPAPTRPPRLCQ